MFLTVTGILHAAATRRVRFFMEVRLVLSGTVRWVAMLPSDALVSLI
jgi:hypothetical protein